MQMVMKIRCTGIDFLREIRHANSIAQNLTSKNAAIVVFKSLMNATHTSEHESHALALVLPQKLGKEIRHFNWQVCFLKSLGMVRVGPKYKLFNLHTSNAKRSIHCVNFQLTPSGSLCSVDGGF